MKAAVSVLSLALSSHEGIVLGLGATGTDQEIILPCAMFQINMITQ